MNIKTCQDHFIRAPQGRIRVLSMDAAGIPQKVISKSNLILYGGADFMAKALGNSGKKLNYLYFEFTNGALPGSDPLSVPVPRAQGVDYYNTLTGADYLRIPITMDPVYSIMIPPADPTAVYFNNAVLFNAMTAGYTTGIHSAPFQDGVSQVYGVALATTGAQDTPTQDVVFSRSYFLDPGEPITKQANQQVAAYWAIEFF